ncbi:ankyrin repeat-containing domain protein [Mycena olivaceomarginata]|nr:ankyrin repeat-containing domain protein [Mycena olivaceomarginata]
MGARSAVVKLLEMYGEEMMAKVHARRDRWTALDYAAHNGHMDVVGILAPIPLPCGVPKDVSEESNSDEPETQAEYLSHGLLQSARAGNLEISQYLISEGAQINFINDYFSGTTPLSSAAAADNLELVQLLLASGADPNLAPPADVSPYSLLPAWTSSRTVLVLVRDIELLRFFLEHGADPNHQDFLGETPLHCACRRSQKACVELLLQFGAAASVEFKANGRTPVNIAMRRGTPEVVKILEPFVQDPDFKREIAKWLKDGEDIG